MQAKHITALIHKYIPKKDIFKLDIKIDDFPHSQQVEHIGIIMHENRSSYCKGIGQIMDALDNYTAEDEYGDITELKLTIDRQYEPDGPDGIMTEAYLIDINIDS